MPSEIDLHIGKRLRKRRILMGLTQQQLGEAIGVRFQQIQKYECAANRITAARLYKLCIAMGVPTNYFFEGLGNPVAAGSDPVRPAASLKAVSA